MKKMFRGSFYSIIIIILVATFAILVIPLYRHSTSQELLVLLWNTKLPDSIVKRYLDERGVMITTISPKTRDEFFRELDNRNRIVSLSQKIDLIFAHDEIALELVQKDYIKEVNSINIPNLSQLIPEAFNHYYDQKATLVIPYSAGLIGIIQDLRFNRPQFKKWLDVAVSLSNNPQITLLVNTSNATRLLNHINGNRDFCTDSTYVFTVAKVIENSLWDYNPRGSLNELINANSELTIADSGMGIGIMRISEYYKFFSSPEGGMKFYTTLSVAKSSFKSEQAEDFINFMFSIRNAVLYTNETNLYPMVKIDSNLLNNQLYLSGGFTNFYNTNDSILQKCSPLEENKLDYSKHWNKVKLPFE
ncbi:MAG: hypothetical protein QM538_04990 [Methylacidiphilales bacterium]|nr:hypothetical protein [Candidatus Methylacidiphilales bacterium]